MRECTTNLDGTETCVDTRVFSQIKTLQLEYIRETAKQLIFAVAPEYKQRNAALGLLSLEETEEIKNHIQTIRTISNQKEAQIQAIVWDGQEATRVSACNAVEAIIWN